MQIKITVLNTFSFTRMAKIKKTDRNIPNKNCNGNFQRVLMGMQIGTTTLENKMCMCLCMHVCMTQGQRSSTLRYLTQRN